MPDPSPLPPIARRLLAAIASGTVPATVSNAELGRIVGCHQRTASRHLGLLARHGQVRIDRTAPNPTGPGSQPTGRRIYPASPDTAGRPSTPR